MIQINQLPSSADVIQTWNIGRLSPSIELRLKVKITPFHHCPRPAESRICMYGGKQARTVIKGMNPHSRVVDVRHRRTRFCTILRCCPRCGMDRASNWRESRGFASKHFAEGCCSYPRTKVLGSRMTMLCDDGGVIGSDLRPPIHPSLFGGLSF